MGHDEGRRAAKTNLVIRVLEPSASQEIALVARRMRQTLMEVLGEQRGRALYSMEELEERVREHLDPTQLQGQVFVLEVGDGCIAGHTIVRVDDDGYGHPVGLFSTIFVAPRHRRLGAARALIARGEAWMRAAQMPKAVTYTDEGNTKLHALFTSLGYALSPMPDHFVALSKDL